jgi:hypothetical protein
MTEWAMAVASRAGRREDDKLFGLCKQNNHAIGLCWELYHHPEPRPASPKTDLFVELKS